MKKFLFIKFLLLSMLSACSLNKRGNAHEAERTELDSAIVRYRPFRVDINCYDCYPSAKLYLSINDTFFNQSGSAVKMSLYWKYRDLAGVSKICVEHEQCYAIIAPEATYLDLVGGYYSQVKLFYLIFQEGEFSIKDSRGNNTRIIKSRAFRIYSDTTAGRISVD